MPSERSMPSEITGLKAERQKARSISLQTCCRPFWITLSVIGSSTAPGVFASWFMASSRIRVVEAEFPAGIARQGDGRGELDERHVARLALRVHEAARLQGARYRLLVGRITRAEEQRTRALVGIGQARVRLLAGPAAKHHAVLEAAL